MRCIPLVLLLASAVAACSGDRAVDEAAPVEVEYPASVVRLWIDTLADARFDDAHALVEPLGLAVVVAVENDLTTDQLATFVEDGVAPELVAAYWSSFGEAFEAFRGLPLASVVVGDTEELSIEGVSYSAVEISSGEVSGEVIARQQEDGAWQVDMVGTVGAGLAGPMGDYLVNALTSATGEPIAQAFETAVVPGLSAALERNPINRQLVFDIEFIVQVLAQRPLP